jgi:hypothetical protein
MFQRLTGTCRGKPYAAGMLTLTLLPILITGGVLALVLLWPRVRLGPSGARLVLEVGIATLALFALLSGLLAAAPHLPW